MQRSFSLLLVLAFVTFASAANVAISVGSDGLKYTPADATVSVGDNVTWTFVGSHTVTQSSAKGGCSALTSGFASPTQSSGTFSWIVTGTGPWYYYCAVNGHCAAGMVGSLTLASTSANGTASTKSAASGSMTTGSVTGSASDTASSSGTSSSSSSTPTSSKVSAAVGQIQTSWVVFALVVVALTAMLV